MKKYTAVPVQVYQVVPLPLVQMLQPATVQVAVATVLTGANFSILCTILRPLMPPCCQQNEAKF